MVTGKRPELKKIHKKQHTGQVITRISSGLWGEKYIWAGERSGWDHFKENLLHIPRDWKNG